MSVRFPGPAEINTRGETVAPMPVSAEARGGMNRAAAPLPGGFAPTHLGAFAHRASGAATVAERRVSDANVQIGLATPDDAAEIHALLAANTLHRVKNPGQGWVHSAPSVERLRYLIAHVSHCWVARVGGRIAACVTASPPTWMPHHREHVALRPEYAERALDVLQRGQFVYVGSAVTHRDHRRDGVMSQLIDAIAAHYTPAPLVGFIGLFSQNDFQEAHFKLEKVRPSVMNSQSLAFHHKRGFVTVGYHSGVQGLENPGVPVPMFALPSFNTDGGDKDAWPYTTAALVMRFAEPLCEVTPPDDPLKLIREATARTCSPDTLGWGFRHASEPEDWALPFTPGDRAYLADPSQLRDSFSGHAWAPNAADCAWEREYYLGPHPDGAAPPPEAEYKGMQRDGRAVHRRRMSSFGTWFQRMWPEHSYASKEPSRNPEERAAFLKQLDDEQREVRRRCPSLVERRAAAERADTA